MIVGASRHRKAIVYCNSSYAIKIFAWAISYDKLYTKKSEVLKNKNTNMNDQVYVEVTKTWPDLCFSDVAMFPDPSNYCHEHKVIMNNRTYVFL